jgi:uncharacterized membrane protein (UPF0127 family)
MISVIKDGAALTSAINADTYFLRLRGLIGRKPDSALLLDPCNQIHTFFMSYPIDAVYIGAEGKILKIDACIRPNRMPKAVRGAKKILELPAGKAEELGLRVNDTLTLMNI